jgi:hypothetical protein
MLTTAQLLAQKQVLGDALAVFNTVFVETSKAQAAKFAALPYSPQATSAILAWNDAIAGVVLNGQRLRKAYEDTVAQIPVNRPFVLEGPLEEG